MKPIKRDTLQGASTVSLHRLEQLNVASHHDPVLKIFADHLRAAGKPHKVVITALARKRVTIANTLCRARQKWKAQSA